MPHFAYEYVDNADGLAASYPYTATYGRCNYYYPGLVVIGAKFLATFPVIYTGDTLRMMVFLNDKHLLSTSFAVVQSFVDKYNRYVNSTPLTLNIYV